ncbi:MAG: peptidase S14 [Ruminococcaceae bacterium]|nr:peptidase S14 [Oscillospiraceae bacterium]
MNFKNEHQNEETEQKDIPYRDDSIAAALQNIVHSGAVITRSDGINLQVLTVIGQIEGHGLLPDNQKTTKYEHLIPLLAATEESDAIHGLLILLNTVGGDVEAGLALSELIASMHKPTVSLVLGGGHSIGVPLAVSARRSFIVPSATMTLHPVRTNGLVVGAPQSFLYFERIQERIIRFVTEHSGISADRMRALLLRTDEIATDMGSILDGEDAVNEKLIDEVGGLKEALSCLHSMINSDCQKRS